MLDREECGTTYEAKLKNVKDGQVFACKSMKKEDMENKYYQLDWKSEMYLMDNTNHPNIVRVFDVFED